MDVKVGIKRDCKDFIQVLKMSTLFYLSLEFILTPKMGPTEEKVGNTDLNVTSGYKEPGLCMIGHDLRNTHNAV